MVIDCIIIQKEIIFGIILLWSFLAIVFVVYNDKRNSKLTFFNSVLVCIGFIGICLSCGVISYYILLGLIKLWELLPCIRVV